MILREKVLGFRICTPCTLNCQYCSTSTPQYRKDGKPYFVSLDMFQRECQGAFKIYDFVECVTLSGGEPLLHKDIADITAYTLKTFSSQFNRFRITTNGTMLPSAALLDAIHTYSDGKVEFTIDDYGPVSDKVKKLAQILRENHIPFRIDQYTGENQYCGGWVDFGPLNEFRGYSEEKVHEIVQHCHFGQWKCLDIMKGKLFLCPRASIGFNLGYFSLPDDEYIDLLDSSQSLAKKREIAAAFGTKAVHACQYCNGFDPEKSKRVPGGVQMPL